MKKRITATTILLMIILLLAGCGSSPKETETIQEPTKQESSRIPHKPIPKPQKPTYEDAPDWMSKIADDKTLGTISIPGTHDSCANYDFPVTVSTAKTQDLTLAQQLNAGVRHFDIRPCLEYGKLRIHHGIVYQNTTFDEVWSTVTKFLDAHPSEAVILAVQGEWTSEDNHMEIVPLIYDTIKNDSHFFGTTESLGSLKMSQIRGKVIITGREEELINTEDRKVFSYPIYEVEDWVTSGSQEQWVNYSKPALDNMKTTCSDPDTLYSLWLNCYVEHTFGIPNIREASSVINPNFLAYIADKKNTDFPCVIVLDHITETLCHAIYSLNF